MNNMIYYGLKLISQFIIDVSQGLGTVVSGLRSMRQYVANCNNVIQFFSID